MKRLFPLCALLVLFFVSCHDEKDDLSLSLRLQEQVEVRYPRSQSCREPLSGEPLPARLYLRPKMNADTGEPVVPDLGGVGAMRVELLDRTLSVRIRNVSATVCDIFLESPDPFADGKTGPVSVPLRVTVEGADGGSFTEEVTVGFWPSLYELPVVTLKKSEMDPDEWIRDHVADLSGVPGYFGMTPEFFAAHPDWAFGLASDSEVPEGAIRCLQFVVGDLDPLDPETFREVTVQEMIETNMPSGSYYANLWMTVTDPFSLMQMIHSLVRQEIRLTD